VTSVTSVNREIRLVARPQGVPDESLFEIVDTDVPVPGEGQVLIRNAFISVDPYMRVRMNAARSYAAPFTLGEAMGGGAVGRIAASRNSAYGEGEWVVHLLGWREWSLSDGHGLRRIDPTLAPVSTALGVLGMPGMSAWWGISQIGRPREGETVFVSGAAGAVGSAAAQLAKLKGARVTGSVGSAEKLAWVEELGVAAFDYKRTSPRQGLETFAPDGIDVYFDNVGGDHLEAAIGAMNQYGRIVACGGIARYSDVEPEPGPRNMFMFFTKRLTMQGFIVSDHYDAFDEFLAEVGPLVRDGRLRYRETVVEGVENAPAAFLGLLTGANIGKMLVKVGPGPNEE
jgi:NADPH-dependent curcumin reductase CurA